MTPAINFFTRNIGERLGLTKNYYIKKGIELVVITTPKDNGSWFRVECSDLHCKNFAGYYSNSGQKQVRHYICEKHTKSTKGKSIG